MPRRLEDVLEGREANYILPFIWQRGDDEAIIREEMAHIDASGIKAVCTLTGELVDLISRVEDDVLYWDVPERHWRVFLLVLSPTAGSERHQDYIN